ncbi:MAG: hypothetical protein GY836_13000, partial [Herbaspirillum sp.]|uniref:hypothetical protein n=1 Tax=Herbaspirillum sp. TaxID=1890675 RepID=UPI002589D41E
IFTVDTITKGRLGNTNVKNRSILYTEADPTDDDIANNKTDRVHTTYTWAAETMLVNSKTYTYAVMSETIADDWRATLTIFTVDTITKGRLGNTNVKNRSILYTEADPTDDDIANNKTDRVHTTYTWAAETMLVNSKTYTYAVMSETFADDWRSTLTIFTVDTITKGRLGNTNVKNRSILYTEADPTDDDIA